MSLVAAIDIGGTTIKGALVDSTFAIIASASAPTPVADFKGEQSVQTIAQLVQTLSLKGKVSAIGLGIPGAFDEKNRIARWAGNLGWKDLAIGDLLSNEFDVPIACGHDVRLGALAELRAGAALGKSDAIFIAVGTGISAGLIIDGAIRSASGYAGEIGHLNVGHSYTCVCGKVGCLEAISSASAIGNIYSKVTGAGPVSAEEVISLAKNGDPVASQVWTDALLALTKACEILVTTLAPEVIIFGGGLSGAGEELLCPISNSLDEILTFQRKPEMKIAHFGSKAGMIGCAMLAFDLVSEI